MSYREVQRSNSTSRSQLSMELQKELKHNSFRNVGWDNVIALHNEIARMLHLESMSLEELYLEADRVGNKYLSKQEIASHRQALAIEVDAISQTLDELYPAGPREEIDFSKTASTGRSRRRARQ
ncbi:MAG: hypothetical protein AB4050_01790 [Synechococcus sp.]